MDNKKIAKELLKVAKALMANQDEIFIVKQGGSYTLWSAYAPGSGTTAPMKKGVESYITDKRGHENYDDIVRAITKGHFSLNKVIEVGIYDYTLDQKEYKVFGGNMKPFKKAYMVITQDANIVINFFYRKGEASNWAKDSK